MTGMRGEPCPTLYQTIHMVTGKFEWVCREERGIECPPGKWCPIAGDPDLHVVRGKD